MSNSMFNKASVPVADLPKKSRPLTSQTLFTNNFFHLTPVFRKPIYVGDSLKVNAQKVSRTLPMPYPAFSAVNDIYRAFFVPYTAVFKGSEDFFEQANHFFADGQQGMIKRVPYANVKDILEAFTSPLISEVSTSSIYDFTLNSVNYRFTERGAQIYKVFLGLGYDLFGTKDTRDYRDTYMNLLPLFCYLRVFFDWYWPRNYVPSGNTWGAVRAYLSHDLSSGNLFNSTQVLNMLLCCGYSFYDDRAFVDGWDNPVGPSDPTLSSDAVLIDDIDPTMGDSVGYSPVAGESAALIPGQFGFTKFAMNALNSLSDFLKRNQLAGASAIQRFLARHGKKLNNVKDRSIFLGEQFVPVRISDVAATNQSASVNLGDLSGKGWSDGTMSFELKDADNRGMFLILCSTLPDGELFQGIDKYNLCTTALEFYQPEFYNNGVAAVSAAEVYTNPHSTFADSSQLGKTIFSKVFEFLPQWYQYNLIRNMILGDFRLASRGADILKAAHSFRELTDSYWLDLDQVVHSLAFQYGIDSDQYQRLTYLADADNDFLQTYIRFNCEYNSSIPLISDTYSFDSDAQHSHGIVTINTGGVEKS